MFFAGEAEVTLFFVDCCLVKSLLPAADALMALPKLRGFVVLDEHGMGDDSGLPDGQDYERLMASAEPAVGFPDLNENQAAGLCYTSGTTGDPKGVLYSHRAYYLHSLGGGMVDSMAVGKRETVMPVVPMFHANAWGFPYTAAMTGAKLVLPGMHMGGSQLADLVERERVTLAAGVPTLWTLMLQSVRKTPRDLSSLRSMIVGGSAVPRSLIEAYQNEFGIPITQAWGMTETTPVGCCARLKNEDLELPMEQQLRLRTKQGLAVPGVEVCIVDDAGEELLWDGQSVGELCVRGPWVAGAYFGAGEHGDLFTQAGDGKTWFHTGDIASIDEHGYIEITDRKKDLIKSRGEWISSVALENCAMSLDGILEAAVTGRPDRLRDEVPVLWVVADPEAQASPSSEELLAHLSSGFERWMLPRLSDVLWIDSVPKTSVGKFDKKVLRARWQAEQADRSTGGIDAP